MATIAETFAVAVQHHQAGNLSQAEHLYRQILQVDPRHVDSWCFLGAACQGLGKLAEAEMNYRRAIQLRPDFAAAYYNLALAMEAAGRKDEAALNYRQALRLNANYLEAAMNLGNVLKSQSQLDEAITCYRRALQIKPDYAEAHANLANVFAEQGKVDEAVNSWQHALLLQPKLAQVHYNLGYFYAGHRQFEKALACYREAVRLKPTYAEAFVEMGNAQRTNGQMEEGLASYDQAIRLKPDFALAHWNRAVLLLLCGDFERGWPAYEWRWAYHDFAQRKFTQPLWDGSELAGRTILLYAEQGLGDTLQFIRFAPQVKQRGGKVILEGQPSLLRLAAAVGGIDRLVARGDQLPAFDVQAPLLTLPGIFHASQDTIPKKVPYLHADLEVEQRWGSELERLGGFKVGIAWQGSLAHPTDHLRSLSLKSFACLAAVEGIDLVSLQKGSGNEQLAALAGLFPIYDVGNRLQDFMDTAAVVKNLDLVITCDSAVAHLAGALGAAVWVVLPLLPDWRWLLQREDSPWYPTMRLFRQTRFGQWDDVFDRMAVELRALVQRAS